MDKTNIYNVEGDRSTIPDERKCVENLFFIYYPRNNCVVFYKTKHSSF